MDSFTQALGVLDPANRALLDLSLRRGMRPEEISDLLGTDPESVIVAREQALEQLASQLGMGDVSEIDDVRARLAELPPEAWTPPLPEDPEPAEKAASPLAPVEPEGVEPREEAHEPDAARAEPPADQKRKSRIPLLLTLLAVAALVLVVILASSGGSDQRNTAAKPAPTPPPAKPTSSKPAKPKPAKPSKPAAAPTGPRVVLAAVAGGGGASGSAALAGGGKRLVLDVSGLPTRRGAYQVWLYNSVIDSHSLVSETGSSFKLDLKLPANASRYHYVDISFEPKDGNPNHSGASVLRAPLSSLAR